MASYYSPYGGFPSADPWAAHKPILQRNAHFVGALMLFLGVLHQSLFAGIARLLQNVGVLPPDAFDPEKTATLGLDNTAYLLLYLAVYMLVMGLPMLFAGLLFRPDFSPLDLSEKVRPSLFIGCVCIGLAVCSAANVVASVWASFFENFGVEVPEHPSLTENEPVSVLLNLFIMAVLPAVLEEFLFRGYVLQALRPYGDTFAVIMSALLFGLMHSNLTQLPFAFLLGLIFGFFAVRLGNIWVGCVIHFLNNAIAVLFNEFLPYYVTEVEMRNTILFAVFGALAAAGIVIFIVMFSTGHPLFQRNVTRPVLPPISLRLKQFTLTPMVLAAVALFAVQTMMNMQ